MDKKQIKEADFTKEADIFKAIGHPVRLKIVFGLLMDECCVKDIWECMDLPQALVSQHLSLLKNKGIVASTREGNRTIYRVDNPLVVKAISNIDLKSVND